MKEAVLSVAPETPLIVFLANVTVKLEFGGASVKDITNHKDNQTLDVFDESFFKPRPHGHGSFFSSGQCVMRRLEYVSGFTNVSRMSQGWNTPKEG